MAKQSDIASRLRHRITLEKMQLISTEGGQFIQNWQVIDTVWAEIVPSSSGGESLFGEQLEAPVSHRITLRYRADVDAQMRVAFGERIFNIRKVFSPEERRETLVMLAEEHVAI